MPILKKSWKKILTYTFSICFLLMISLWALTFWYVNAHKKDIIQKIENEVSNKIDGQFDIKDIQPEFLRDFPMMAFRIDSVTLKDSLYSIYHKNLLEVAKVYVRLNLWSIVKGEPAFSKLTIDQGKFQLFVDSNGYSNAYLLHPKLDSTENNIDEKKAKVFEITNFEVYDFQVLVDNLMLEKRLDFNLEKLNGSLVANKNSKNIKLNTKASFKGLGFNLDNGSFLKNAVVKANLDIDYFDSSKTFVINKRPVEINGEQLYFSSIIVNDKNKDIPFVMNFDAPKLNYNEGVKWLSENIFEKLKRLKFKKPINVKATIHGGFTTHGIDPDIKISFDTKKNDVNMFSYGFNHVDLQGFFVNRFKDSLPAGDHNSRIYLDSLNANFDQLPIHGKNISVDDLTKPFVRADLRGAFPASAINPILGDQFRFNAGNASYNLRYNGNLFAQTLIADEIYGDLNLQNAEFVYVTRKLKFRNTNAILHFNGNDLNIEEFKLQSENNDLSISGSSQDFLTAFMELPGKAMMDLQLSSKNIDFGTFKTYFVQKRSATSKVSTSSQIKNASKKLDEFLSNSNIYIKMNIAHANYNKFTVSHLLADMRFQESGISIEGLSLEHAGGGLTLQAGINQQAKNNPFQVNFDVHKVKVDQFFKAMSNFGFSGLTDKNLEGLISLKGKLNGNITDEGTLLPNSLEGSVNYLLSNAALKNYGLFDKIKNFFKNRHLENVQVPSFNGSFALKNGFLFIPTTQLNTSAFNLTFSGTYGLKPDKPTAINFSIPLRNPQVDIRREERGLKPRKGKGIILNFNATSDKNGKINIGVGNATTPE